MSLYQISFAISGDQVEILEELLFEIDDGHWNIYLNQDTQKGKASGLYETELETEETWKHVGPYFEELIGEIEPSFESLPDKDWKDSYKEHFNPWSFEGLHWVPTTAGAVIYTLIESCRRHGIEPQAYLCDVLKKLPSMTNHQTANLTPDKWIDQDI